MVKNLNEYKALETFIKSSESFEIHDNKVFCKYYKEKQYNLAQGIANLKIHLVSKKHIKSVESKRIQSRLNFKRTIAKKKQFFTPS